MKSLSYSLCEREQRAGDKLIFSLDVPSVFKANRSAKQIAMNRFGGGKEIKGEANQR